MSQDIYRRASGQHAYDDAREKFRLLWSQFNELDYMWTLLTLIRAFQTGGYHARAQVVEETRNQCYLHAWNGKERYIVRYIHNQTPLYGLYTSNLAVLEKIGAKERADHLIVGIRTVFSDDAEGQARKLGITLRDGFDLMELIETTVMPEKSNSLCPACGSALVLKIVPESTEGIAWVCTGRRAKRCVSTPKSVGGNLGTDNMLRLDGLF